MKKTETEKYSTVLDGKGMADISDKIRTFLSERKVADREVFRYALTVEEILYETEKVCGAVPVRLKMGKRFKGYFISLEIEGKTFNAFAKEDSEQSVLGDSMLKNIGLSPDYSYANDKNVYSFSVKRKQMNPFFPLVISVALAVLAGFVGFFFPDATRTMLLDNVLSPLSDAFLDILNCIAGPMIFLSVAWGIYGIGDAATLKRIGKKLCFSYVRTVFFAALLIGWLALPLFDLNYIGNTGGASAMSSLFTMLLGIIPKNIFTPFVDGNTLQIIVLACVSGIAMLFLGKKSDSAAQVVESINYIVMFLIEAISKLIPIFIFLTLLKIIWGETLYMLAGVGKITVVFLAATLVFHMGLVGYTSLRNRVNPLRLVRKGLPSLLIALSTASSAATFGTNLNSCRDKYGIDEKTCLFSVPLGVVMNKPTLAINYVLQALFFAEMYSLDISVSWLVILLVTSVILAIATPPIPGGGMAAYTVLFLQLGIPQEALAIALACETVFDFVMTGFDQFSIQMVLFNLASKLGLVDREKLLNN